MLLESLSNFCIVSDISSDEDSADYEQPPQSPQHSFSFKSTKSRQTSLRSSPLRVHSPHRQRLQGSSPPICHLQTSSPIRHGSRQAIRQKSSCVITRPSCDSGQKKGFFCSLRRCITNFKSRKECTVETVVVDDEAQDEDYRLVRNQHYHRDLVDRKLKAEQQLGPETVFLVDTEYGHTSAPTSSATQTSLEDSEQTTTTDQQITEHLPTEHLASEHLTDPLSNENSHQEIRDCWSLTKELGKLSNYGWYWGPITRVEAEEKLVDQCNGAFLVRDSSDDRYLLSLSFRSFGRTLHTRIEHCNGVFSFYAQPESEGYTSIVALVEQSMTDSQSGVFCYSRARTPGSPSFPVRLTRPVSRLTHVRSLQSLCRFVIRQHTRLDHIAKLPLPTRIQGWLQENQY